MRLPDRAGIRAPRVSIGLPVYNGGDWLARALESLCRQTFEDFELIISDNMSDDETQEIASAYAKTDPRIRYFRQPRNIGARLNFQYVFEQSRGNYFMWAAHDDEWSANYVELLAAALDRFPEVDFAFSDYEFIDESSATTDKGRVTLWMPDSSIISPFLRANRHWPKLYNAFLHFVQRNPFKIYGMYRRRALENGRSEFPVLNYNLAHSDTMFLLDIFLRHRAMYIAGAVLRYRARPREISSYADAGRSTVSVADLEEWLIGRMREASPFGLKSLTALSCRLAVRAREQVLRRALRGTRPVGPLTTVE